MKPLTIITSLSCCLSLCSYAAATPPKQEPTPQAPIQQAEPPIEQQIAYSKDLSKQLAGQLKKRLMSAVKSAGLKAGVSECKVAAPQISMQLASKHPETLISAGRVSLKARNPNNQADSWQTQQLQHFEQQAAAGETGRYAYRLYQQDGKQAMEFMSPIPTQGLCLNCHGEKLAASLSAKIDELYPHDKARGYQVGDIRGAFVIRSWLATEDASAQQTE